MFRFLTFKQPKQKMKMKISLPPFLALFEKHQDSRGRQAKLKTPLQLQELMEVTRFALQTLEGESGEDHRRDESQEVEEKVKRRHL